MRDTAAPPGHGRTPLAHEPDFVLGGVHVHPSLSEVEIRGQRQHLEPRVMQVLVALARAEGNVLSRDDLTARCWDGVVVGEDAINRVIGKIRRVAQEDGACFRVETLPRIGYRLTTGAGAGRAAGGEPLPRPWSLMLLLAIVSVALAVAVMLLVFPNMFPASWTRPAGLS